MSVKISGSKYAAMYGPTVGDKVRLADTSLVIEVEKDYTTYGDEVKFGGGKSIRDGMGQSVKTCSRDGDLDLVITNALIVDATGIVKADIGIKDGKIAGIGKAGNPDIMDGVTPGMTVGASTEALAGEGMIVTAGGIDTHIHFISPQQIDCALYSGVTTMIGGGTGPADGTNATTCTPGPWNLKMMLKAAEEYPMNLGFLGKGNCSDEAPLIEQVKAGAMGLKIHEDWGATPAVINHCLNVADEYDVQVAIHTDTLNEGGCVEDTLAAIGGRTIHTYHTEGAGGGHAPDIIRAAAAPNVLPSSTNPTMPYTVNTLDEHLDMLMVCHHLDPSIAEDIAFAESLAHLVLAVMQAGVADQAALAAACAAAAPPAAVQTGANLAICSAQVAVTENVPKNKFPGSSVFYGYVPTVTYGALINGKVVVAVVGSACVRVDSPLSLSLWTR